MKQIIYEGRNDKCLIFNMMFVDIEGANQNKAMQLFTSHLEDYQFANTEFGDYILSNINLTHVESTEVHYDGQLYWKHTYVVVYELPYTQVRECIQRLNNRYRERRLPMQTGCYPSPVCLCVKTITGYGKAYCYPRYREDVNENSWARWLCEHSRDLPYTLSKVISVEGINSRDGYVIGDWFNTPPQYKVRVSICSHILSAINTSRHWLWASHITCGKSDRYVDHGVFNNKLYADIINNTLVISDNENVYGEIKGYLNHQFTSRYGLITISQYGVMYSRRTPNRLIITTGGYNSPYGLGSIESTLMLYAIDRRKIKDPTLRRGSSSFDMLSFFVTKRANRMATIQSLVNHGTSYGDINVFLLPYDRENITHKKALTLLQEWFNANSSEERNQIKNRFIPECITLSQSEEPEEDAMSAWFKSCTANAESDTEKLKRAYEKLKVDLLKEYKEVGAYLATQNLNNKKPIPTIKLGAGLEHNPDKKLSFQYTTTTYNMINNIELPTPVTTKTMEVRFMLPLHDRNKTLMNGNIDLEQVYNKQDNEIVLEPTEMIKKTLERAR